MRLEYLREMIDTDRRFPRRQEADFQVTAAGLPAIVQPSELMKLEIDALGNMSIYVMDPTPLRVTVRIMSISHVWESMEHPDHMGFSSTRSSKSALPSPPLVQFGSSTILAPFISTGPELTSKREISEKLWHTCTPSTPTRRSRST